MDEEVIDQSESPQENRAELDLDALASKLSAKFDERFSGFQSLLDRRYGELQTKLEDLETASLEPEERIQATTSKAQAELARVKRENEMLRMRKQYAEEVDFLDDFLKKSSLEDQLTLLANFRKAQTQTEAQGEPSEEQPTPVQRNNPPRKQQVSLADLAQGMTGELADKLLSDSNEPGFLARLRRG